MKKQERPIARTDLGRSIRDCYRIESAIWQQLQQAGCTTGTDADGILLALVDVLQQRPEWCEQAAWETIADSFARWSELFGDLRLFMALRRKRDE